MKRVWMGIALVAVVVLAAGGAFYGGMKLGQNQVIKDPMKYLARPGEGFAVQVVGGDFPGGQAGAFFSEGGPMPGGQGAPGAGRQGGPGLAVTIDTIQSIDGSTLTINRADGTVKVITTDTTYIQKYMAADVGDLEVGEAVIVQGSENDDGSITARSIRVLTGIGFPGDVTAPQP